MATRAEQKRAETETTNSKARRAAAKTEKDHARSEAMRLGTAASKRGRALHGRTKLQADAKALKPRGETERPNGGEERTINNVAGTGRGSDGEPSTKRPSRKSTRGAVPGGEKPSNKTRSVKRALATPERRAAMGK